MKKLTRLTLLDKAEISIDEQKSIRGGYDLEGITCFSGDGSYFTFADWHRQTQNTTGGQATISSLASECTGTVGSVFGSFFDAAYDSITQTLLDRNYSGSSYLYVDVDYYGNGGFYNIRVYDAITGSLIQNI